MFSRIVDCVSSAIVLVDHPTDRRLPKLLQTGWRTPIFPEGSSDDPAHTRRMCGALPETGGWPLVAYHILDPRRIVGTDRADICRRKVRSRLIDFDYSEIITIRDQAALAASATGSPSVVSAR